MKLTTDDQAALQGAIRVLVEILQQSPPEVPDTIEEWPEDDSHLRGDCWEGPWATVISYRDGKWLRWNSRYRIWNLKAKPGLWTPLTRTTDPSLPRTWDSLDAVPEDVARVTGDYAGRRDELARSGLCESGWFQRIQDNAPRRWVELPAAETNNITNIQEEAK